MAIRMEKPSINPVQLASIIVAVVVNVLAIGMTYANYTRDVKEAQDKISLVSGKVDNLSARLDQLGALQYQQSRLTDQVTENKLTISDSNKKLDRALETVGTKLDTMVEGLNSLKADVKVLSARIDSIQGASRTRFTSPIFKP